MESGDGLVVRIRPWSGSLTLDQAAALANAAQHFGNGQLELTRRANLQLRGLQPRSLPDLHAVLADLGLLDTDEGAEAVRNVMVAPLAGLDASVVDVRPVARALTAALGQDRRLWALPAKFGWLVDGGGIGSIAAEQADVALCAVGDGFALRLDRLWIGTGTANQILGVALAAAHAFLEGGLGKRMRSLAPAQIKALAETLSVGLQPVQEIEMTRERPLGLLPEAIGLAVPFGQLEAEQLRRLVAMADECHAEELRLSPWRIVYVGARGRAQILEAASSAGFVSDPIDPVLRIDACPGAPSCASATVDSRKTARWLARSGFAGTAHVSGCAKGCARSAPADLVLVGEAGHYRVVRNGTTLDPPQHMISSNDLETVLHD